MEGGLLEAFGKLFTGDTSLYVYPFQEKDGTVETSENVLLPENLRHLYQHLKYNKCVADSKLPPSPPNHNGETI